MASRQVIDAWVLTHQAEKARKADMKAAEIREAGLTKQQAKQSLQALLEYSLGLSRMSARLTSKRSIVISRAALLRHFAEIKQKSNLAHAGDRSKPFPPARLNAMQQAVADYEARLNRLPGQNLTVFVKSGDNATTRQLNDVVVFRQHDATVLMADLKDYVDIASGLATTARQSEAAIMGAKKRETGMGRGQSGAILIPESEFAVIRRLASVAGLSADEFVESEWQAQTAPLAQGAAPTTFRYSSNDSLKYFLRIAYSKGTRGNKAATEAEFGTLFGRVGKSASYAGSSKEFNKRMNSLPGAFTTPELRAAAKRFNEKLKTNPDAGGIRAQYARNVYIYNERYKSKPVKAASTTGITKSPRSSSPGGQRGASRRIQRSDIRKMVLLQTALKPYSAKKK